MPPNTPDSAEESARFDEWFDSNGPSEAERDAAERERFMNSVRNDLHEAQQALSSMEETLSQVQQHLIDSHNANSYGFGKYLRECAGHLQMIKWTLIGLVGLLLWRLH